RPIRLHLQRHRQGRVSGGPRTVYRATPGRRALGHGQRPLAWRRSPQSPVRGDGGDPDLQREVGEGPADDRDDRAAPRRGLDRVVKRSPRLYHHPEEWMGRDSVFERTDVDPLVKRAIYTTMIRCVSEVILSKGPRVLMVKAVRGYSKGYWNIPGGFMDYGEGP